MQVDIIKRTRTVRGGIATHVVRRAACGLPRAQRRPDSRRLPVDSRTGYDWSSGSVAPTAAKPAWRSRQLSQRRHGRPSGSGS
jgi:hypothetical protein